MALTSAIYEGWVRHRRHRPRPHDFRYRLFQLFLDLSELDRVFAGRWFWSVGRRNLAWLRRSDYYGDPALTIDEAVRQRVDSERGQRPTGPIRLLTHARYFGTTMNPVSFYFGYLDDGETLDWVLAEITNTPWGERHAYLLPVEQAHRHGDTLQWDFDKAFHVSPFMAMHRRYRWAFRPSGEAMRIHMDVFDGEQREFDATMVLRRRPLTGNTLASCLARYPFMTAKVGAAIYWQAARLWFKRSPFHPHPDLLPRSHR